MSWGKRCGGACLGLSAGGFVVALGSYGGCRPPCATKRRSTENSDEMENQIFSTWVDQSFCYDNEPDFGIFGS